MAKDDIAQQWLQANDPKARAPSKAKMAKGHKQHLVAKARTGAAPVFYHPLDERAHNRLVQSEAKIRKNGRFCVMSFVSENQGFGGDECLFVPFHIEGTLAAVLFEGQRRAANVMLILTQGWPQGDARHARHKCGNGHKSCVNPRHLCWGTSADNSLDRVLHTSRPSTAGALSANDLEVIRADNRLPNVIAVERGIPSALVQLAQSGEL